MILIYWISLDKFPSEEIKNVFDEESLERQSLLKRKVFNDLKLSLAGRYILKLALWENFRIRIKINQIVLDKFQKPYIPNLFCNFNISHSGNIVVCAISVNSAVGIDVEKVENIELSHFQNIIEEERFNCMLNSKDPLATFYSYWTKKEAILKADGRGLGVPLKSFEILNNRSILDENEWHIKNIFIETDYVCHIAFKQTNHLNIKIKKIVV